MRLYIDPGTGSMLFAILIGVIGAAGFLFRNAITKIKFLMSGGKSQNTGDGKIPFVIFSDDKRYWQTFEPICRELDKREFDVVYMTASEDDAALDNPYEHVHAQFIGAGNKAFAKLNFLEAKILFATTPGLDVYQWKRSKKVDYYVHIMHAPKDITMYRMFGIDYYDSILLNGKFQIKQVRQLEKLRNLPQKELVLAGIPYMDDMVTKFERDKVEPNEVKNILLAPSWGESAILSRFGGKIIDALLKSQYHIIIRPHPQSVASEKDMLDKLMAEFPNSDRLEWNYDSDNYQVLKKSDVLISDFSGVLFEFSLVYDRPVLYANTNFDSSPYDAWWLEQEPWTFGAMARLGAEIKEENLEQLPEILDDCINNPKFSRNRQAVREEIWVNYRHGAEVVADYFINKYNELKDKESKENEKESKKDSKKKNSKDKKNSKKKNSKDKKKSSGNKKSKRKGNK